MLRSERVHCRLATGYLVTEQDKDGKKLLARSKHAHAWTEVLTQRGWVTVDATPAQDQTPGLEAESAWDRFWADVSSLWDRVTGFDDDARRELLQAIGELPGRTWRAAKAHPFRAALIAVVITVLGTWWRRARRRRKLRRVPRAVVAYHTAWKATGLATRPGETPRAALHRARSADIDAVRLAALETAVTAHEFDRYGTSRTPES